MVKKFRNYFCIYVMVLGSVSFAEQPDIWMKLYNGKDLTGWKGLPNYWSVNTSGYITSGGAITANTFLVTDSLFNDFHIKLEGRFTGTTGALNSGIMYRSQVTSTTTYETTGYQYEFSHTQTQNGAFWHEKGSELQFTGGCTDSSTSPDWKKMEIIADGPHVIHLLNGVKCFEYSTFKILDKGKIGLQMHFPGDFAVEFRNIYIQPINNSFSIPANNAWDGNGNKISITSVKKNSGKNFGKILSTIKNGASNLSPLIQMNGRTVGKSRHF